MSGMRDEPRTVSVVGNGRVTVPPDVAILTLGVETTDRALATAQRENATRSAALRARLAEWGLPAREIQTAGYNVWQDHDRDGQPRGYRVSNTVRLLVSDLARVGELLDTAIDAGANSIGGVAFGHRPPAPGRRGAPTSAPRPSTTPRSPGRASATCSASPKGAGRALSNTCVPCARRRWRRLRALPRSMRARGQ